MFGAACPWSERSAYYNRTVLLMQRAPGEWSLVKAAPMHTKEQIVRITIEIHLLLVANTGQKLLLGRVLPTSSRGGVMQPLLKTRSRERAGCKRLSLIPRYVSQCETHQNA